MKDDLISRKSVLRKLSSGEFDGCSVIYDSDGFPTHISLVGIKNIIKTMTAAFDKEKVIEEISNVPHGYYNVETKNEIIEIVKKGGIE